MSAIPLRTIGDNGGPPLDEETLTRELLMDLGGFHDNFAGFVRYAFPWGMPGSALQSEEGPDEWQRREQNEISAALKFKKGKVVRRATASGHGIGKSAEVAWAILWVLLCRPMSRGVITANTATQLETKTWAELSKWFEMLHPLIKRRFVLTATAIYHVQHQKGWRIDAIPNNPKKPAAFAGLHNDGRTVLIIFDEASEIERSIYETTEGACTDAKAEIIWLTYGNPTMNNGPFHENVVGKHRHRWTARQVDSRNVKRTNKDLIAEWVEAWGEDSDFIRTRVRGVFPRLGTMQLISSDSVQAARERKAGYIASDPLVAGLDVARYGDDQSVLYPRRGRDAQSMPILKFRELDLMTLAGRAAQWCDENQPDAFFVDVSGMGVGVYDRMIQLNVRNVYPADFAGAGRQVQINGTAVRTANLRASMYCAVREWLPYGALVDDPELETDLTGVQYGFNTANEILLEPKAAMKKRGLASPDIGDALALTFAMPVQPRVLHPSDPAAALQRGQLGLGMAVGDYDLFADLNRGN